MQSGSSHKGAKISWSLLSVGKVIFRLSGCRYVNKIQYSLYSIIERGSLSQAGGNPRFVARRVSHCPACSTGGRSSGIQLFLNLCQFATLLRRALDRVSISLLQLPVYDASKAQLLAHGVKDGAGCHLAARCSPLFALWTHSRHMSSVSWTHFASPQLLGWTFGLHCKQPCGCGENTNDGATKNSQVLTFGENKKHHWAYASRSSLGLPVQSSYGETIPHTYFTSSLRCGLHTVFLILFTELPWNLRKVFV